MTQKTFSKITICGGGLAGQMCAAALAHILHKDIEITLINTENSEAADIFYGTVTSPSSYDFLLSLGITEPEILLKSDTSFSFGTHYQNWGKSSKSWIQSFHPPLPVIGGVDFHHYVVRHHKTERAKLNLEPYIMSVQAGYKGVFAHPPEGRNIPLAKAEYGYQFQPKNWTRILSERLRRTHVTQIKANIEQVHQDKDNITALILTGGHRLEADLFIDCTGLEAQLISKLSGAAKPSRRLTAITGHDPSGRHKGVYRTVTPSKNGWRSETPLQNGTSVLNVYDPSSDELGLLPSEIDFDAPIEIQMGHRDAAWQGNCLALGHSAAVIEPLTPAPMIVLQRDIQRLCELVPVSNDMTVERREYNRRFETDNSHADMFKRALVETEMPYNTAYWQAARGAPLCDKLATKITQFESRGVLVQYDYEPFSPQDWAMLHFGMGRTPLRYDRLADLMPPKQLESTLSEMSGDITAMCKKMPPHEIYMTKLKNYLKDKYA